VKDRAPERDVAGKILGKKSGYIFGGKGRASAKVGVKMLGKTEEIKHSINSITNTFTLLHHHILLFFILMTRVYVYMVIPWWVGNSKIKMSHDH